MRIVIVALGFLFIAFPAFAEKVVVSGQPLVLYETYVTNPDCSSFGPIVLRVVQSPEHGRVTIRHAGVFPNFPEANPRSVCNRRRVPGIQATYVSQRGYTGSDFALLEAFFPRGRGLRISIPIRVM